MYCFLTKVVLKCDFHATNTMKRCSRVIVLMLTILTSSLKKHVFYNWLINNILYLCVT